ncbi:MAG: metallophosphoesterase family protein [Polyangiales bacterium]
MRIVHAADLHVDSPMRGLERYEGAPVDRVRHATRDAFVRVIDTCLAESASFLILAGDVFDEDWKDYNTGIFFVAQLQRLRAIGCRVLVLRGNHDFELTRALKWPDLVYEFAPPKAGRKGQNTFVFEAEGVAFHGVSYPSQKIEQSLLPEYPAPLAGLLNFGVLHTNATSTSDHARYAPCTPTELAEFGYDYWALGHVHRHAVLSESPWIVYPGNTQGRHANETGKKGCIVIDVEAPRIEGIRFVDTSVMRFHRLEVALEREDGVEELHERVSTAIADAVTESEGRLAAVRVIVRGACRAHAAVCQDPARIKMQIRADVIDRGGDAWLEKIELATTPETSLEQLREAKGLVADLLRRIEHAKGDDAELDLLAHTLEPLQKKLGRERAAIELDLGAADVQRDLLAQAELLLAHRLTEGE